MDTEVPIVLCWLALFTFLNSSGVSGILLANSAPQCSTDQSLSSRKITNPIMKTTYYSIDVSVPTVVSGILFNIGSCSNFNRTASTDISMMFVDASDVTQIPRNYSSSFPGIVDVDYRTVLYELDTPLYVKSLLITTTGIFDCANISIKGCELSSLCSVNRCMNGGTCTGTNRCECAKGYFGETCEKRIEDLVVKNLAFQSISNDTLQTSSGALHVSGNISIMQSLPGSIKRRSASSGYLLFQGMGGNCSIENTSTGSTGKRTLGLLLGLSHVFGHLLYQGFSHTSSLLLGHNHNHNHVIHLFNTHHGWNPNNAGASLTYNQHKLNLVVNNGRYLFHLEIKWRPRSAFPYVLTSSYSPLHGCSIFANGQLLGSVLRPSFDLPRLFHWVPCLCFGSHCNWDHVNPSPCNYVLSHIQTVATSVASLAANGLSGLVGLAFQSTKTATNAMTTTTAATTTTTPTTSPAYSTSRTALPPATASATAATVTTPTALSQNSSSQLLCYSCDHMPTDGACFTPKLCNSGEVCSLFQDPRGYTHRCLKDTVCANAKAVVGKRCWECCTSSLCNQMCTQTVVCKDSSQCSLLISTGYSVCSDPKLASTDCKKTCGHCSTE